MRFGVEPQVERAVTAVHCVCGYLGRGVVGVARRRGGNGGKRGEREGGAGGGLASCPAHRATTNQSGGQINAACDSASAWEGGATFCCA